MIAGGNPIATVAGPSADHLIAVLIASACPARGGELYRRITSSNSSGISISPCSGFHGPFRVMYTSNCSLVRSVSSTPQLSRKMTDRAGRRTGSDSHA